MKIRLCLLIICGLLTSCSQWYLTRSVEIKPQDIPTVARLIDTTKSEVDNIHAIQKAISYNWKDFIIATTFGITEGVGLGLYESKVFYSPKAFPGMKYTWFYDWVNMKTGGDYWMKIGHPDKIGRTIWLGSAKVSWNRYLRFFGGNWVFAYLAQFTISNTVAEIIRQQAKYGTFNIELNFDWRIIDALFK